VSGAHLLATQRGSAARDRRLVRVSGDVLAYFCGAGAEDLVAALDRMIPQALASRMTPA